jgi:hypothetical protein
MLAAIATHGLFRKACVGLLLLARGDREGADELSSGPVGIFFPDANGSSDFMAIALPVDGYFEWQKRHLRAERIDGDNPDRMSVSGRSRPN